jgi:multidrug efflux pump subunit AcrB
VTVKMLPFDNKSEFQVVMTCPRGHAARGHRRVATALADEALGEETRHVTVQSYVGTASPYNFNGLVRHYFLRRDRTWPTCR